jgi:hypothetical protein
MPYYIYRIKGPKQLEHLETKDKYREAKLNVSELRSNLVPDDPFSIRMVFARSTEEAEKLLSVPRDPRVIGED